MTNLELTNIYTVNMKTSAERMRKLRLKRKEDVLIDQEEEKRKERERIRKYRVERKERMLRNESKLKEEREKERLRKKEFRSRKKKESNGKSGSGGKGSMNKKRGEKVRRNYNKTIKRQADKIKMFENTVRRLKRKKQILSKSIEDTEPLSSGPSEQETSSILLSVVSPSAKKKSKT